jgi:integrase
VQVADRAMRSCTFADVPFRKLRRSHVEAWVKAMSGELAPSTVRTRFNYVGIVIRGAAADRVLAEDVTKGVNLPPLRRREIAMELPTTDQVGRVLEAADEHWATLFALCAFAGLRLGEAAGVQAGDIQFPTRTLRVRRQVQRKRSGEVEIKAPKAGSERDVNLPDELLAILSEHLRRGVLGEAQWLFVGPHGNPPDRGTVNYWWRKATAAAGVDFHLHALRHFYASALIDAGCSVVTVQRALGHANPTITLNVYSHLFPSMEDPAQTAAADLMTKVLRRPVGNSWATEDLTPS